MKLLISTCDVLVQTNACNGDAGYRFDETVLNGISRAFDPHHREEFSFGDFISIMVFLKTTQMVFTSFDVTRSGTIELNYSQFLYAALTTR